LASVLNGIISQKPIGHLDKMDEKIEKCIQCGESFPESDGKFWSPQHAAIPFLSSKHYSEPISGFLCKKCSKRGKHRFYFFLLFLALLFVFIFLISI
jgi:hypothetical protein